MSAAQQIITADMYATPDWARLVPLAKAAEKLGVNPGHLRRTCQESLQGNGMAIFATPPAGGHSSWFIYPEYDGRLLPGELGKLHQEPDLSAFSEKQIAGAMLRRTCVEAFKQEMKLNPKSVKQWVNGLVERLREVNPGLRVSRASLFEWHKKYIRPADLVKLIDPRGGDKRSMGDAAAWSAFKDLFLHENRPTLKQCWREVGRMAKERGWCWCGLNSCYNQIDNRIPPLEQLQSRDPSVYRQRMLPTIEQDTEAWPARICWVGDHHQLNLWCRFQDAIIRPWLTTFMDWRTRKITGWVLSANPDSRTILAALRNGLEDEANLGGPDVVWSDNGRDYDSYLFHAQTKQERLSKIKPAVNELRTGGIAAMLKLEWRFSLPYSPNGKSRQERYYGTLEPFYRTFETYAGNSPANRPERLAYVLGKPGLIPPFKDVYERIKDHIAGYNASSDHDMPDLVVNGERLSPDQAMQVMAPDKRVMADPVALNLLMQFWNKPVTVGKNGIAIAIMGKTFRYGQFAPELRAFKALKKADRKPLNVSYDPHDVSRIRVYDQAFRFICEVGMNQLGGLHGGDPVSVEKVSELCRQKAAYAKATRHKAEFSITGVLTAEEHLAQIVTDDAQKAARAAAAAAGAGMGMKIVNTPLDGQSKEVRRQELKKAVGDGTPELGFVSAIDRLNQRRQTDETRRRANGEEDVFASDPWARLRTP